MKIFLSSLLLMLLVFIGCTDKKESTMFHLVDSGDSGITFSNTLVESDTFSVLKFEYLYNGGGVGVADFNNDGLPDIFFAGNMTSSALYLNKGDFKFNDITTDAGVTTTKWCSGVSVIDINQDGLMDIYVSTIHPDIYKSTTNILFLNQGVNEKGIPVFKDIAPEIGLADNSYSTQAVFFDYDQDGDLDMYLLTNALEKYVRNNPIGQRQDGTGKSVDKLFRQERTADGGIYFNDVSKEAGILTEGWGLGIVVNDFNDDGWPDIYCANDFLSSDHLYINQKDGTFRNAISDYMNHQEFNGMGVDMADLNNDGFNDLVVTDMMPDDNLRQKAMFSGIGYDRFKKSLQLNYEPQYVRNVLQINNKNRTFSEIGLMSGVYATDWSWATLLADYDNDGMRDIFITNGYPKDITDMDFVSYNKNIFFGSDSVRFSRMNKAIQDLKGVFKPNFMFQNAGDYNFINRSEDWGLSEPSYSNGAAYADLDLDGDLDLIINNLNSEASLYRNNIADTKSADKNYLRVKLNGKPGNLNGLGTKLWVYCGNTIFYAEHQNIRGYMSSVESVEHFGLGGAKKIDSLVVVWSSGKSQVLKQLDVNQLIEISENDAVGFRPKNSEPKPLFSSSTVPGYIHQEDDYVDFKYGQATLPHKFSQSGPGVAVGDLNGDGLDDMVVGGSANQPTTLFIQNKMGQFSMVSMPIKAFEDTGILLFDADQDGDLDIYCVSGSSEFGRDKSKYQDRMYLNDGKANFTWAKDAIPSTDASGGPVVAADIDHDGDLDIFIGGRIEPQQYPQSPRSFLLINDGNGRFKDETNLWSTSLMNPGMISSAIFSDYNNDSWVDLILVGEFMPITVFKNNEGKSFEKIAEFNTGWWNSITGGDFDNDGDIDYIAGNLGENSIFRATEQEPVTVYFKDFDNNGSLDPFLTRYLDGKEYMVHFRETMTEQVVGLRRVLQSYSDFGKMDAAAVLNKLGKEDVSSLKATWMHSSYIENKGNDTFEVKALPRSFQFAPIFGVITCDINNDEFLDFIAVGNSFAEETIYGYYDAGIGICALGNGDGTFNLLSPVESGFFVRSDAKALAKLISKEGKELLVVTQNRDSLKVFTMPEKVTSGESVVRLKADDEYAIVEFTNGKKRKEELYRGNGYLSSSSRALIKNKNISKVTILNRKGE